MQQSVLIGFRPHGQMVGAEPDQPAQRFADPVLALCDAALDRYRNPVLGPSAIEERDQPIAEEIEEVLEGRVVVAKLAPRRDTVVERQHRRWAAEADEGHGHRLRPVGFFGKLLDLRGGKRQAHRGPEAKRALAGIGLLADRCNAVLPGTRRLPGTSPLQDPNRLEKLEFPRFVGEPGNQRRTRDPARGGHVRKISVRPRTRAVVRENELIETYSAKKRSITDASRNPWPLSKGPGSKST